MTNPLDSYTDELNALSFSEETKNHMAERIAAAVASGAGAKAEAEAKAAPTTATTSSTEASGAPSAAQVLKLPTKRQAKRTAGRAWYKVAASVAVAAAVLVGGGTAAVAAGIIPPPSEVFADIFFSSPTKTEVIDKIGYPLDASCTSNGVTVTAEAVIGDAYNYTIVFSVAKDDGSAFDTGNASAAGTLNSNVRFLRLLSRDIRVDIDGVDSSSGSVYFYDQDSDDNAIQLVYQVRNDTNETGSIVGRTARFHMANIVRYGDPDSLTDDGSELEETTIASGEWNIDFELNYEDTSIVFAQGVETTYTTQDETDLTTGKAGATYTHTATINKASVSYVGITVDYTVNDTSYEDWEAAWEKRIEENGKTLKGETKTDIRVEEIPITITMKDGTTLECSNEMLSQTISSDSNGLVHVVRGGSFTGIVETDEIASITIGSETFEIGK